MPERAEVLPIGIAFDHPYDDAGRCALLGSDPREISQIVLGFSNDLRISACIAITSRTLVSAVCIDAI